MKSKKVNFTNQVGINLEGLLETPSDDKPIAYAIFAHCFTCTKSIKAANVICRALATKKIAILRFDFTGLGRSGGDFADSTFSSDIQDIVFVKRLAKEAREVYLKWKSGATDLSMPIGMFAPRMPLQANLIFE